MRLLAQLERCEDRIIRSQQLSLCGRDCPVCTCNLRAAEVGQHVVQDDDEQEAYIPVGKGTRKRRGTLTAEDFDDDDDSDGGPVGGGK